MRCLSLPVRFAQLDLQLVDLLLQGRSVTTSLGTQGLDLGGALRALLGEHVLMARLHLVPLLLHLLQAQLHLGPYARRVLPLLVRGSLVSRRRSERLLPLLARDLEVSVDPLRVGLSPLDSIAELSYALLARLHLDTPRLELALLLG